MNKIKELIKTGEGYFLEFKEKIGSDLGKEICAFANSDGGQIILGVSDDKKIKGFALTNKDKSKIQDIVRNFDPEFSVDIEEKENLTIIKVLKGRNKPYSVGGKFYIRIGSNSQRMNRNELKKFFQKQRLFSFDEIPNEEFNLENDFDELKFKKYLNLAKITSNKNNEIILKNLGLLKEGNIVNAGVLLFSHRISKFLLQGKVTCVLFEGNSRVNIIDKKEFDGDLISNYENAYNFILSKLNTRYIIEEKRVEELELPKSAIREALMNAFCHRDYFSKGNIQINIFIDRVEIKSPGGLVEGLTEKDLGNVSLSRNPLLFDLISRTPYVERAGTGIERMRSAMKKYGLKINFENVGFFNVIFSRKVQDGGLNISKNAGKNAGKKERQKLILEKIKEGNFNQREFALEIGVNKSTIERDLKKLKNKINFVGSKKGGYWKLNE